MTSMTQLPFRWLAIHRIEEKKFMYRVHSPRMAGIPGKCKCKEKFRYWISVDSRYRVLRSPAQIMEKGTKETHEKYDQEVKMTDQMLGHLFLRPSANLEYSESSSCRKCSMPGIAWPGKFSCFSGKVCSAGMSDDCRRRWLLRWGLFWARTSFGFCGVFGWDCGSRLANFGSLKCQNQH